MVRLEFDGRLGVLVLDRPPVNAFDQRQLGELEQAVSVLQQRPDLGAVLIRTEGRLFSAGADIGMIDQLFDRPSEMAALANRLQAVFGRVEALPAPTVAAIRGAATGGGLELALACDIRFAAEGDYRMGLSEANVGLFPGNGGTQRLPRIVGLSRGIDMIAQGTGVTPVEAREMGLVDRLFPPATLQSEALAYATQLASGPTEAIGHAKVAATLGYGLTLDAGLAIEREGIARVFATEDAEEGIRAFGEKRKPNFKGR